MARAAGEPAFPGNRPGGGLMTRRMHGVAVDAGSGLAAAIAEARGAAADPGDHLRFKEIVLTELGPEATTVLLDADCGPKLLARYPDGCAPMLAYEADVYHISGEDRITRLPDNLAVADYPRLGVRQLKFFMYYAPNDPDDLNHKKCEIIERIGRECGEAGIDFLFEPLVYDRNAAPGTAEFAAIKPGLVERAVATFAQPRFNAAVLKVEVPVDLAFVDGFGQAERSRDEALAAFRNLSRAAGDLPIVFLSAGVPFDWFEASLNMANDAGCDYAGFMCGRAIWSDAVGVFGQGGADAMRAWLADTGLKRLRRLKAVAN